MVANFHVFNILLVFSLVRDLNAHLIVSVVEHFKNTLLENSYGLVHFCALYH